MTDLTKKESMERFIEGLKISASCARECAQGTGNMAWLDVARHLDNIRKTGEQLEMMKALTFMERESHIERIQRQQHTDNMVEQSVKSIDTLH